MILLSSGNYLHCFLVLVALSQLVSKNSNALEEIKIGILMRHRGLEEPLNRTLDMLNNDTSVLMNINLVAIIEMIESDNSYQASAASKCDETILCIDVIILTN